MRYAAARSGRCSAERCFGEGTGLDGNQLRRQRSFAPRGPGAEAVLDWKTRRPSPRSFNMSTRILQVSFIVVITACFIYAADLDSVPQLDCVCTSTHFVDVSFAIKCWRNSTRHWTNPKNADDIGTFTEESSILCKRELPPPPGADYQLVPDVGFYKFHPRQTTWEDALRTCASEGGNLAVVNSEAEADAMASIFSFFPKLNIEDWLNDQAWIGVTDLKTEGVFLSLRGLTLQEEGWERWEKGEPNNEGDGEHCAVFNRDKELTDEPCSTKLSFFCERPLAGSHITA